MLEVLDQARDKRGKLKELYDLYIRDPKDSTGKFLGLINTFNKMTQYKINMPKDQ